METMCWPLHKQLSPAGRQAPSSHPPPVSRCFLPPPRLTGATSGWRWLLKGPTLASQPRQLALTGTSPWSQTRRLGCPLCPCLRTFCGYCVSGKESMVCVCVLKGVAQSSRLAGQVWSGGSELPERRIGVLTNLLPPAVWGKAWGWRRVAVLPAGARVAAHTGPLCRLCHSPQPKCVVVELIEGFGLSRLPVLGKFCKRSWGSLLSP